MVAAHYRYVRVDRENVRVWKTPHTTVVYNLGVENGCNVVGTEILNLLYFCTVRTEIYES